MAIRYDLRLNDSGDLDILNNDWVLAGSDKQHIQDTINAHAGWWKESFIDGVGISSYLNSSGNQQELTREIKIQLQSDGYVVNNPKVQINPTNIQIEPNATRN